MRMLKEFRQFILRGNVVDLAVAVIIGAAFGLVVQALVKDIITPIIAAIGGQPDFSALDFEINGSTFRYGHLINAVVSFLIVSATVFFVVVKPVNVMMKRLKTEPDVESETRACPECLSHIPVEASRCAFCTAQVAPAGAALSSAPTRP
jgi:large conductance mechanosensitive channel